MALEILDRALVCLRFLARPERAEVAALAGRRIWFPRVQAVPARWQFADHGSTSSGSECHLATQGQPVERKIRSCADARFRPLIRNAKAFILCGSLASPGGTSRGGRKGRHRIRPPTDRKESCTM